MSEFNLIRLNVEAQGQEYAKTDLYGFDDLKPNATLSDPFNAVLQACFRVLDTPRGGLFYAPNYGAGIADLLADSGNRTTILGRCENAIVRTVQEVLDVSLTIESENELARSLVIGLSVTIAEGTISASFGLSS